MVADLDLGETARLERENEMLRARLEEAEATLRAIRQGEVDALVIDGDHGSQVFTLVGADQPYRVFVEKMQQGVVTLTPDGFILYCNHRFAALVHNSLENTIGSSIYTYVLPADRPALEALLLRAAQHHGEAELTIETIDHHAVPVYVVLSPLHAGTEAGIGLVITDLSEQKRNEAIVAAEKLARSILDQAASAIVVCDLNGRVTRANRATRDLCGVNPIGQHFDAVFPLEDVHDGDISAFSLADILEGGVVQGREARLRRPYGHEVDLLINAGPLRSGHGHPLGCVISLWDISGRKAAERERAEMLQREQAARAAAEAAVRQRDQFLSVASHELKTPLTVLLGNTQAILRRVRREPYLKERDERALNMIVDQAQRLNRMIAALLDISRLETGQFVLERAPIDLCALARQAVEQARPPLTRHALSCIAADQSLIVIGDEMRLGQVLENLIQNAIRYSPAGGHVAVQVTRHGRRACLTVKDEGIGIPAEALPRLFTRFYRAPNAEAQHIDGMGIGLYVVKVIVELHGGTVAVESVEGAGSTFTVWLPLGADIG